ncbi:CFA61 protein, partial [Pseudoatta argentina]
MLHDESHYLNTFGTTVRVIKDVVGNRCDLIVERVSRIQTHIHDLLFARVSSRETSCLSVVQYNERRDVISGTCLCNYPNIPSVSPDDWLTWLKTIYGIPAVTERNTMFIHLLVWDELYSNEFLRELLTAVFDNTTFCQYVVLVIPSQVEPVHLSVFEQEMTKVLAKTAVQNFALQFLYLTNRHRLRPKLKIRRVVEEDNDDVIEIIGDEGARLKKLYGEHYISKMIHHPSSCRQLIIGEDTNGSTVGVMYLNATINIDLLNENFELKPYNGLKKSRENDRTVGHNETMQSQFVHHVFPTRTPDGEINAFVLEVFATRNETRPHWSYDFLEAAFDCFPHLEYCKNKKMKMQRVPLRCNRDFPMTLYVLHRVVYEEMRCRRARTQDREAIERLLFTTSTKYEVLADFDFAMDPLQAVQRDCFVFESNDTMLGLAILCAERQVNFVTNHYHIEDYVSVQSIPQNNYGRLLHFVLMPIFSAYHRFFFRELARLSELTVIFYRLHHKDETGNSRTSNFHLIPQNYILYKKSFRRPFKALISIDCASHIYGPITFKCIRGDAISPFLLVSSNAPIILYIYYIIIYYITTSIYPLVSCLNDMIPVDPRRQAEYEFPIVQENFNNSENNTKCEESDVANDEFSLFMTSPRLAMMPRTIIDTRIVVIGASDCGIAFAEYLTLRLTQRYMQLTNLTLISPNGIPFDNESSSDCCEYLLPFRGRFHSGYRRYVVARTWLNIIYGTMAAINREAIFFYGCNIDCYCTLGGLIKLGVEPSWISFMDLFRSSFKSCNTRDQAFFHDYEVNKVVTNAILRSGVQVFSEWTVIDWTLIENEQSSDAKLIMIKNITIEKEEKRERLTCDALFNFYEKTIDLNAFLAFCRAGLVFDGSLVINSECRTNDPFIFAAGTMTKYSRKFYADVWQHKYYNSMEVGEKLAQILWKVIEWDVQVSEQVSKKKEVMHLTPSTFRAPIVIACILPGDYHYLHVCKPGKATSDNTTKINHDHYGNTFITGSCKSEIRYFRIRLNMYDTVESVTCVSRKSSCDSEQTLLRLNVTTINLEISDFYAYFREPWAAVILHDRFDCLRVENRATLLSRTDIYDNSLDDDCINTLIESKWKTLKVLSLRRYPKKIKITSNLNTLAQFINSAKCIWTLKKVRYILTNKTFCKFS